MIDNPRRKPKSLGVFLNSENASMTPNFMVIIKFYRRIQVKTLQTSFNCIIVFINSIYIILTNYTIILLTTMKLLMISKPRRIFSAKNTPKDQYMRSGSLTDRYKIVYV